jgi:hypothetical protein
LDIFSLNILGGEDRWWVRFDKSEF